MTFPDGERVSACVPPRVQGALAVGSFVREAFVRERRFTPVALTFSGVARGPLGGQLVVGETKVAPTIVHRALA
jgi:hypothetical protein